MSEARIFTGSADPAEQVNDYKNQHCLVEEYDSICFMATFDDGKRLIVGKDETRPYTIADDNRRQSEHYRNHPRVDAVD